MTCGELGMSTWPVPSALRLFWAAALRKEDRWSPPAAPPVSLFLRRKEEMMPPPADVDLLRPCSPAQHESSLCAQCAMRLQGTSVFAW